MDSLSVNFTLRTDWPTHIVGIYSPVYGSGKTTVAKIFRQHGFKSVKMAAWVKRTLFQLLIGVGVEEDRAFEYLEGNLKQSLIPELGVTGRFLMADYATRWAREINPDIWIKCAEQDIKRVSPNSNGKRLVVIDDIRFSNEYNWLAANPRGYLVKLVRPSIEVEPEHRESEGNLTDFPFQYIINNDKDLAHLGKITKEVIDDILGKI